MSDVDAVTQRLMQALVLGRGPVAPLAAQVPQRNANLPTTPGAPRTTPTGSHGPATTRGLSAPRHVSAPAQRHTSNALAYVSGTAGPSSTIRRTPNAAVGHTSRTLPYVPAVAGPSNSARNSAPAIQPSTTNTKSEDCLICTDTLQPGHAYKAPCNEHYYCSTCLRELFEKALKEPRMWPASCCKKPIPPQSAKSFIGPDLAARVTAKSPEMNDKTKIYCHIPHCSTYIPTQNRTGQAARCPSCSATTCMSCKQRHHPGQPCGDDRSEKQMREVASKEGWKDCPKCGRWIELTEMCNHITCSCGHQFCYECRKPWYYKSHPLACRCEFVNPENRARAEREFEQETGLRGMIIFPEDNDWGRVQAAGRPPPHPGMGRGMQFDPFGGVGGPFF